MRLELFVEPRRWNKLPAEKAWEIVRLHDAGWSELEIVAFTTVSKGSVWRVLKARDAVAPAEAWTPREGRLTLADRVAIAAGLHAGESFTEVAQRLERSVSTISREVGGCRGRDSYDAVEAHGRARQRARRPKRCKLETNQALAERVEAGLEALWSPHQISARLKVDFPDDPEMRVSHETIYKTLFVQSRGGLRRELTACLRSGRTRRRPRHRQRSRPAVIPEPVMISERPAEVDDRAVPGHWEGDLIIGANNASAIGTLVERTTRYVMLLHLGSAHTAETVRAAMAAKVQTLPTQLFKTLTWDQGSEMVRHREFTIDTGIQVYFCDPRSPWQRGTNENTNGLLRQYLPKGTDLAIHSEDDLDRIAASLNNRPRQTLNWQTPAEALAALLAATG